MKVTGFKCVTDCSIEVSCEAFENNVAFICDKCKGPVLIVVRDGFAGNSKEHPKHCGACHTAYFLTAIESESKIVVSIANGAK